MECMGGGGSAGFLAIALLVARDPSSRGQVGSMRELKEVHLSLVEISLC